MQEEPKTDEQAESGNGAVVDNRPSTEGGWIAVVDSKWRELDRSLSGARRRLRNPSRVEIAGRH